MMGIKNVMVLFINPFVLQNFFSKKTFLHPFPTKNLEQKQFYHATWFLSLSEMPSHRSPVSSRPVSLNTVASQERLVPRTGGGLMIPFTRSARFEVDLSLYVCWRFCAFR
ncbi:hypothetical protein [Dickeya dianthicola]|uniref:hypothetical protein n=1 Tax=Dickeya dianthicola TaxID=204039 RepID=UPI00187CE31B|nr:hypothetical protein [Dickeya dianthicola]MBI0448836.1 hypothetical protein [Dickeya dianthicola]MBI0457209.1 hypothetical protein [Dickeya dianthicola]MBI0462420.1 hypothetical protein [Dickeya dianthicola]MBI0465068.1 hypothetical protein [Dickeya dianthicola]MBI0487953.1 hypothetical protein [Dickeya dianthicola]